MLDQYNQMKKMMKRMLSMSKKSKKGGSGLPPGFDKLFKQFGGGGFNL